MSLPGPWTAAILIRIQSRTTVMLVSSGHGSGNHPPPEHRMQSAPKQTGDLSASDVPTPPISDPAAEAASSEDVGLQIPRQVIRDMKDKVFGFDCFFVTGTENYEADGVLFKGNLRGDAPVAFAKMERRLRVRCCSGCRSARAHHSGGP